MGHLRIIHVRLGAISGFMSDIAPCVKSAGSGNGPVTIAPWNNATEMQPPIENSGAQLFNKAWAHPARPLWKHRLIRESDSAHVNKAVRTSTTVRFSEARYFSLGRRGKAELS